MWEMIDFDTVREIPDTRSVGIWRIIGVSYDNDSMTTVDEFLLDDQRLYKFLLRMCLDDVVFMIYGIRKKHPEEESSIRKHGRNGNLPMIIGRCGFQLLRVAGRRNRISF